MEKEKFECLKDLANLENCIECVKSDVTQLMDLIKAHNIVYGDKTLDNAIERSEHLTYWFEKIIKNFK